AYGADAYLWTLKDNSDDLFYIVNNSANPAEIRVLDGVQITQSTDLEITLTGFQGSCQSTIGISIPLEAQTNDNIANAIEIATGTNGPFTNSCATIEEGEPVPPFSSCTGQLSWCDEYGTGENIVEKSIWFTFVPEANRTVTIYSVGFDNQIAVYKAGSAADIVSGNYSLLAANDDYTESDFNPRITSLDVEANQKYWIQVDGSAGGATGAFNLIIGVLSSIEETGPAGEETKVYPQPADAMVTFESSAFTRCSTIRVELFDSAGRIVCQDTFTESSGTISLVLGDMPAGVYFARIYCDKEVTVVKVVV
ncbi:MAG: T9SS type A sorting domain-containing protein, partial [Bacteroidales bacterium]